MSLEEQKELFVEAIRNEDLKKLKQLIKNGFTIVNHINNKINRQFGDFTTPLHLAACRKNVEVVKFLILHGAQIEAKDFFGYTPLYHAREIEVLTLLLESGAQIEAKTKYGDTPLHKAVAVSPVCHDNFEVVKFLIENGAQIEAKTNFGDTPLHKAVAVCHDNFEVVKFLIENGAEIEAKTKYGNTPLHKAVLHGNFEHVKVLVENGAQIDVINDYGKTPVDLAPGNIKKFLMEHQEKAEKALNDTTPEENVSNKNPCVICLAPKNGFYVLMPCMHSSLCESCSIKIMKPAHRQCPSCRQPIEKFAKIFFQ